MASAGDFVCVPHNLDLSVVSCDVHHQVAEYSVFFFLTRDSVLMGIDDCRSTFMLKSQISGD
jgi:hypothetical protein